MICMVVVVHSTDNEVYCAQGYYGHSLSLSCVLYGGNQTITAITLKLKEQEAEEEDSSSSKFGGEDGEAFAHQAIAMGEVVMHHILEELAALNHHVNTITL